MNETSIVSHDQMVENAENNSSFLDFLLVLANRKKLVIGLPLIVGILATVVCLVLPNIYRANTKLLPPQQSSSSTAGALLAQLGGAAGAVAGAAGIKNPNDLYIGMLKSRLISDKIISRYGLMKVYDKDSLEKARMELGENTFIATGKDSFIVIEVEDKDRQRSADMANAYVEELLKLTKVLAVTQAGQQRMFYEQQLELAKDNLAKAEAALKTRLDKTGVVSVDADSRAIVEVVSRLRAQVSAKEIQIASMQAFVTQNNQEYKRAQEELASLKDQLSKLQNGSEVVPDAESNGLSKSTGLESIKILRDVKYYQMLYEILSKQYELARLEEAKNIALIQVLDTAIPPELKYKPKRANIILTSVMLAFLFAVILAFMLEVKRKSMLIPERAARWNQLRASIGLKR